MFMLNELLIKELSEQVGINTSNIQNIKDDFISNIKLIKVKKYFGMSPGWHKEAIGNIETPNGYTYLGIIPEKVDNDNVFPIYSYYNGKLYAEVYIAGGGNLNSNYYCYLIFIKTDYLSKIFIKQIDY